MAGARLVRSRLQQVIARISLMGPRFRGHTSFRSAFQTARRQIVASIQSMNSAGLPPFGISPALLHSHSRGLPYCARSQYGTAISASLLQEA